jgi:hypothetical protein
MSDFFRFFRRSAGIVMRNDSWFLFIGFLLLVIVGAFTHVMVINPQTDWKPWSSVAQAEGLGSLLAIFLFAGLLDPEVRSGANEIAFSKPMRPSVLLGVRVLWMTLLLMLLLTALLLTYRIRLGYAAILPALLLALPSCLFTGMVALTISQYTRTPLTGIAVSIGFWLWNATMGLVYNPLVTLTAGSLASSGAEDALGINLTLNKLILLGLAAGLFALNVRRVGRFGGEPHAPRAAGFKGRALAVTKIAAVLFAYFWTGAVAKLWTMNVQPSRMDTGAPDPSNRPFQGMALIGSNRAYQQIMMFYGPVPLGPFLGANTADFLRGVGVGLDSSDPAFARARREALERVARSSGPWKSRALLELAALDATPAPFRFDPTKPGGRVAPDHEPALVTVGLADPARWWIFREPVGADLEKADDLCRQALAANPPPVLEAEALQLRAKLAAARWDFKAERGFLTEIVLQCPSVGLAQEALLQIEDPSKPEETAALLKLVMSRQKKLIDRIRLARDLATMQQSSGDADGARSTLRAALADWSHRVRWKNEIPQGGQEDPENDLRNALKDLDLAAAKGAKPLPIQPFPDFMGLGPEFALSNGFNVRSRVLAQGKPLPGVAVALIPLQLGSRCLPRSLAPDWESGRPAGFIQKVSSPPRIDPSEEEWSPGPVEFLLRRKSSLLAVSDEKGILQWSGVPSGRYFAMLRLDSRKVPNAANLSPVPLDGVLSADRPDVALPDLRLVSSIRITPWRTAAGLPALNWRAVSGAARYRTSLRLLASVSNPADYYGPDGSGRSAAGSSAIDPRIVWWKDGVTGTSAVFGPEGLVGPAKDYDHAGIHTGGTYAWMTEAFDASGKTIAVSEPLIDPATIRPKGWTALRSPEDLKKEEERIKSLPPRQRARLQDLRRRADALRADWESEPVVIVGPYGQRAGQGETSPFLEGILGMAADANRPKKAPKPVAYRPHLPVLVSEGQGMPPLPPLVIPGGGGMPPSGPGVPPNLPPEVLARLQGASPAGMPPGAVSGAGMPPGMAMAAAPPGMNPSMPPGGPGAFPPIGPAKSLPSGGAPPMMPGGSPPGSAVSGRGLPANPGAVPPPHGAPRKETAKKPSGPPSSGPNAPSVRAKPTGPPTAAPEAPGKPEVTATATAQGEFVYVEVVNAGTQPASAKILSSADDSADSLAEFDMAPGGRARLRLPAASFPETAVLWRSDGPQPIERREGDAPPPQ